MLSIPAKYPHFKLFIILLFFFGLKTAFCTEEGQLSQFQKEARFYRKQGLELQQSGNIDEALALFQKAVLLDPGYAPVYNDIGVIFESSGEIDRAMNMYLKAVEIAPDYPNSYANIALLYEEKKDYSNAVRYWMKRAMLGEPSDPWRVVAQKRVEDIARLKPEAFENLQAEYIKNKQ